MLFFIIQSLLVATAKHYIKGSAVFIQIALDYLTIEQHPDSTPASYRIIKSQNTSALE